LTAAFSILNILDGTTVGLPAFDVVARPHPNDKADCIAESQRWIEDGMVINSDVYMHEMYYNKGISG
jgi:hypothetical protein